MKHLKVTFEDIMQSSILFYEKQEEAGCFDICNYLQIDNLPALDGVHFFELVSGAFQEKRILEKHKVDMNTSIFSLGIFEQFKQNKHNVLFVFEGEVLMGVVHISDYNRDIVLQAIQDDILAFERKLRELILLHGFSNEDMLEYYKHQMGKAKKEKNILFYENKLRNFSSRKDEIKSLGAFQLFDFSDLMEFAGSSFTKNLHKISHAFIGGKEKDGANSLRELRNMAMHGKNPVSKDFPGQAFDKTSSIYSIDSLQVLMDRLKVLRTEYASISNKIRKHPDRLKAMELENRFKLEIIHDHHPRALQYFLNFEY